MRPQLDYHGGALQRFPSVVSFIEYYSNGTGRREDLLYRILANSQAKLLGWDGTEEGLRVTEELLRRLAFVGIFEEMKESWERLRERLHWDESFFQYTRRDPVSSSYSQSMTNTTIAALRQIQAADLRLYQTAIRIFQQQRRHGNST